MPLNVKAAYSYSATSALTGAWSLTASASIASGDLLIVHVVSRTTSTASAGLIVTPTDNAGGSWQALRAAAATGVAVSIFYNASATTTANFQIALAAANGKTVSARAAHVLVIGGHDGSAPIDLQTYREVNSGASANTTRTASTSLSTTVGNELILAVMGRFGVVTSASADAAWTRLGTALNVVSSPVNIGLDSFSQPAPTRGIYQFSASLNTGGGTPTTFIGVYGIRPSGGSAASLSGTATITVLPTGTLAGRANASAAAAIAVATSAALAGRGSLRAAAAASLTTSAAVAGRGSLSAAAAVSLASSAAIAGRGSLSAAAAVSLATSAAIVGRGPLSAAAALSLATSATIIGRASLTAVAPVSLGTSAAIAGQGALSAVAAIGLSASAEFAVAGGIAGTAGLSFTAGGDLDGVSATASAAPVPGATLLGAGWDPRQFRNVLEARRRELLRRAQRLAAGTDRGQRQAPAAEVVAVQQRLASFAVASPRQAWRLREQAQVLAAIEARLAALAEGIARAALEREDEEILLLAA